MDQLMEQVELILGGIRWQLIITVLAAAAITEQVKKIPWIADGKKKENTVKLPHLGETWVVPSTKAQRWTVWGINALLPELICITACLAIPGVLPDGIAVGVVIFIGYLCGAVSSKFHNIFLKRLLSKIASLFNGDNDEDA